MSRENVIVFKLTLQAKRVKSERISSSHLEIREGQDHIIQAEDNLDDDSKNMAAYIHGRQSTSTLGVRSALMDIC